MIQRRVCGYSLAAFRMVFGLVGALSMARLLAYGWVDSLYTRPQRHFTYPGLRFVNDFGPVGTKALVALVGCAALGVALGWHSRAALLVFVAGFSWIEFIDATTYLNHYWFLTVVGVVLVLAPVDAELALRRRAQPVTLGWIWLLRILVGSVYTYAGLAKLNADWLGSALPLRLWLPARSSLPLVGPLLAVPTVAYVLSWAGAIYDCSIVALLCVRRTRLAGWCLVVAFHVATWVLFPIGVFPWLMIGAATIFFEPDWPRRLAARLPVTAARHLPGAPAARQPEMLAVRTPWVLAALWTVVLLLLPWRAGIVAGDARWTGEHYRFSWNVLRVEKAGDVLFRVLDLESGRWDLDTGAALYTPMQLKVMATEPELIRQAAHAVRSERIANGADVEVFVDAFVSLNGRPAARLIDPAVDLSREPYRIWGQPWILPVPRQLAP